LGIDDIMKGLFVLVEMFDQGFDAPFKIEVV